MATSTKVLYEFGPFRVDPDKQVLLREDKPVALTPKAFETLLILVRHSREVVSKDDLMKAVWPDAFVEEGNLAQNIFLLRKALGDTPEDRRYIVTLPGRGYRFAEEVRAVTQIGEDVLIASRSRTELAMRQPQPSTAESVLALQATGSRWVKWSYALPLGAVLVLLFLSTAFVLRRPRSVALGEKGSVIIADFTNTTNDPVFDETLRQGLTVQLEQSPFLSFVSEDRIRNALRLMGQPADSALPPQLAREICERTAGTAVLEGSIASLGSRYVLGLRAKNCRTGEILAEEQVQADRKEDVLNALSRMASKFRVRIGESLATVEKHDTPLAEASTHSLEALKAYSAARKVNYSVGSAAAIPLYQRAIQIDPKFALAYARLGNAYGEIGESDLSAQNSSKAYQLRDRVSDEERFLLTLSYDLRVTGDLEQAQQICQSWIQMYPRDMQPHGFLSSIYQFVGKYERAVEEGKKAVELDPEFNIAYANLAFAYQNLGRLEEAEHTVQQASARKLEFADFLVLRYTLAFLRDDREGMKRALALSQDNSGTEDMMADNEASVLAYSGHLKQARSVSRHAVELAKLEAQRERAALWETGAAIREAVFKNRAEARKSAMAALQLSKDREVEYGAALALALSGNSSYSQPLVNELETRFGEDTSVRFNYLPALRGLLALNRGDPWRAIAELQIAAPLELGTPRSTIHGYFGALYPAYVRGLAYLAAHQSTEAVVEFQKILDHRGIIVSDPVGVVVRLQLGRACGLIGEKAKAKAAYEDFLALWRDADPDIPILKQAKAEYAKLQ